MKKALKREQKILDEAEKEPIKDQDPIVYVHDAEIGVTLPPHPEQIFAVVRLMGIQHKVVVNDKILVEQIPFEVGQQIRLDDVLMVGTAEYTAIGRPSIGNAHVLATVEEHSQSEKVIIFKKKRRKGYQKNAGHRQKINVLRIDKV